LHRKLWDRHHESVPHFYLFWHFSLEYQKFPHEQAWMHRGFWPFCTSSESVVELASLNKLPHPPF